jgi:predicted DNA-binding transcriptional regulator AlpA
MTKPYASEMVDTLATMSPELAGLAEVADMLDVSKRTASNYTQRTDFPEPIDRLASGPVWRRIDIEAWAAAHLPLPPGRPPKKDR